MNPILRLWRWSLEALVRGRTRRRNARLKAARARIWENSTRPPAAREKLLMELARLDIGQTHEIGIAAIDRDHKMFILLYNRLAAELANSDHKISRDQALFRQLTALVSLLGDHFIEEELVMAFYDYPNLDRHKRQHDHFLQTAITLMEGIKVEEFGIEEFIFYVGSWMSAHIVISDIYFGEYLSDRRRGTGLGG